MQSLRFCSLGSGSSGNCLVVSLDDYFIVFDCGFKKVELRQRLQQRGIDPLKVRAVFVTHEHKDHIGGAIQIATLANAPLYASRGTLKKCNTQKVTVKYCNDMEPTTVGGLVITPFSVPHDANEPLQYTVTLAEKTSQKLAILTDAGHITPHMIAAVSGCRAIYLEFNHDPLMLRHSTYPNKLKGRIAGKYGHLSNQQATKFLSLLPAPKPKTVVAAHLSTSNNTPEKVDLAYQHYDNTDSSSLVIASQEEGFDWIAFSD